MPTTTPPDQVNKPDIFLINKALDVLSGKWRLYIILSLDNQTLRYSQFNERLPGVSQKVLAGELKALVALGVMERRIYAEVPPRVEYTLTQRGQQALPMLKQIQQIGQIFT
ncbi:helix-turn-helix domain-containing protein [Spirosoma sp. SC4-14]|uniref:winged helix-turn-helix transcriptional regulator n=1 Tax=Spirosoma sp. SC4-14 TaxID=3128900 RepID=UPI0030CB2F1F